MSPTLVGPVAAVVQAALAAEVARRAAAAAMEESAVSVLEEAAAAGAVPRGIVRALAMTQTIRMTVMIQCTGVSEGHAGYAVLEDKNPHHLAAAAAAATETSQAQAPRPAAGKHAVTRWRKKSNAPPFHLRQLSGLGGTRCSRMSTRHPDGSMKRPSSGSANAMISKESLTIKWRSSKDALPCLTGD